MTTFIEFAAEATDIKFTAVLLGKRTADGWNHYLWRCTIDANSKGWSVLAYDFDYKCGEGHVHKNGTRSPKRPSLADVLQSLASDAQGVQGARSFEEWCDEYGYEHDSRKAEATYGACRDVQQQLYLLLGSERLAALLDCTEE